MPDDKTTNDETVALRIENAILTMEKNIKKHFTAEIKELNRCTKDRFDKLPCDEIEDKADKANNRITLLIVALLSTGVLGGGIWGGIKMFMGG